MGAIGDIRTRQGEVKFSDLPKASNCESICQGRACRSRTKVRGSKTIRYRRSPNRKLCQLEIGGSNSDSFSTLREIKVFGLWGEYGRKAET
jgi:hypothetical protein